MPIFLIGPEYSTQSERRNKGRRRGIHSNDRTYLTKKVVIKPKTAHHFYREKESHSLDGVFVIWAPGGYRTFYFKFVSTDEYNRDDSPNQSKLKDCAICLIMYRTISVVIITTIFSFFSRIYEWYLCYCYRLTEIYYAYEERIALLTADHDGIMQYIQTKRHIRDAFLKIVRAPFVLVGAISGVVEKGATTAENVFVILETGVRSLQGIVPWILAGLLLVITIGRLKKISVL